MGACLGFEVWACEAAGLGAAVSSDAGHLGDMGRRLDCDTSKTSDLVDGKNGWEAVVRRLDDESLLSGGPAIRGNAHGLPRTSQCGTVQTRASRSRTTTPSISAHSDGVTTIADSGRLNRSSKSIARRSRHSRIACHPFSPAASFVTNTISTSRGAARVSIADPKRNAPWRLADASIIAARNQAVTA